MPVVSTVVTEHEPTNVCSRRVKGQASCPEPDCDQCHLDALNLASVSNDAALGAIAHALTKKCPQFDRVYNLSENHGLVTPSDVNWEHMDRYPTGNDSSFVVKTKDYVKKSEIARILNNYDCSAVDYRDRGMKIRLNVGVEWGKLLKTKKKVHKGYRPMRRVVQVIYKNHNQLDWL